MPERMLSDAQYLAHISAESARFGACLAGADPAARVPSCPDWNAGDLLWHLAEVQLFWGIIVRDRLESPDDAEERKPARPDDYGELLALYDDATRLLVDELAAAPADTHVWTWAADQTVGFVTRRQAHEALIHRIDAELVAGDRTPLDATLAADGVDEALRVMYGDPPSWATFDLSGGAVRIETTDTGSAWTARLCRWSGLSPNTGKTYDNEAALSIVDGPSAADADAVVRAPASELDAWFWNRAPGAVLEVTGDWAVFDAFSAVVTAGID